MSGNGVDLGSIYQLLALVAAEVRALRVELDKKSDKSDLDAFREDLTKLRQDIATYHSAVVGHGMLISEHDDRLIRIDAHLGISSIS